jgi:hypothetical protein
MATGAKGLHREDQVREGFAMRSRRLRWGLALAGLAVVAVGTLLLWSESPSRITPENFERIREGMSRAEVYAILGPPVDYTSGPRFSIKVQGCVTWSEDRQWRRWEGDIGGIAIRFDRNDKVAETCNSGGEVVRLGPIDSLRWRAKRQWHHWFPEK